MIVSKVVELETLQYIMVSQRCLKDSDLLTQINHLQDDFKLEDPSSVIQTLLNIEWICENSSSDELNKCSKLGVVADLWCNCSNHDVLAVSAFCLSSIIDRCDHLRSRLCQQATFDRLRIILLKTPSSKLKQSNVGLLMALMVHNECGQKLARVSGCFDLLLDMFTSYFPLQSDLSQDHSGIEWLDEVDGDVMKLWTKVVAALCAGVSNPQNEDNQLLCARKLFQAFQYLENCREAEVVRSLTLFISCTIANSAVNKSTSFGFRGLKILLSTLSSVMRSNDENWTCLASCYVRVLNTFIVENYEGIEFCGQLNVVRLLVDLLKENNIQSVDKLEMVMALSNCITYDVQSQKQLKACDGLSVLVRLMSETNDQILTNVIKYIFHICTECDEQKDDHVTKWQQSEDVFGHMKTLMGKLLDTVPNTSSYFEPGSIVLSARPSQKPDFVNRSRPRNVRSNSDVADASATQNGSGDLSGHSSTESRATAKIRSQSSSKGKCYSAGLVVEHGDFAVVVDGRQSVLSTAAASTEREPLSAAAAAAADEAATTTENTADDRPVCSNDRKEVRDQTVFKRPRVPIRLYSSKTAAVSNGQVDVALDKKSAARAIFSDRVDSKSTAASPASTVVSAFDRALMKQAKEFTCPKSDAAVLRTNSTVPSLGESHVDYVAMKMNRVTSWLESVPDLPQLPVDGSVEDRDFEENAYTTVDDQMLEVVVAARKRKRACSSSRCRGCRTPNELNEVVLNSTTYNVIIETSQYTCHWHRAVRQCERARAARLRKSLGTCRRLLRDRLATTKLLPVEQHRSCASGSVYNIDSDDRLSVDLILADHREVSLPALPSDCGGNRSACDDASTRDVDESSVNGSTVSKITSSSVRRPRVEYTQQEVMNLVKGVEIHGRCWTTILHTYQFHPNRTAVDLKDKYKQLSKITDAVRSQHKLGGDGSKALPFSMAEERRLKRGVKMFGNNWKAILSSMTFSSNRTAVELRNKWRTMVSSHDVPPCEINSSG